MAYKTEREKLREAIADNLYWEMCRNCPNAKKCHEECEECDGFTNELYKQYKACKVNEPYEEPFKEYTDNKGYTYKYFTIEDLCEQIVCGGCQCHRHPRCLEQHEEDSCYEYCEKLEELKKEGIK